MNDPTPRPSGASLIICPSCGHGIDDHLSPVRPWSTHVCAAGHPSAELCACRWTPNDIAWYLVYGGLTSV
jgi:hypothetical protein